MHERTYTTVKKHRESFLVTELRKAMKGNYRKTGKEVISRHRGTEKELGNDTKTGRCTRVEGCEFLKQ